MVTSNRPTLPTLQPVTSSNTTWWNSIGQYAKGIIGVTTAVVAALQPYYGSQHWFVGLVAGLGALAVIIIPNAPKQLCGTF